MSTNPRNLSDMLPRMPQLEAIGSEYNVDFYSDAARAAFDGLRADAQRAGYRVHCGTERDGNLRGRWWWTWSVGGTGIECSRGDWASEHEAWGDAIIAHCADLMEL